MSLIRASYSLDSLDCRTGAHPATKRIAGISRVHDQAITLQNVHGLLYQPSLRIFRVNGETLCHWSIVVSSDSDPRRLHFQYDRAMQILLDLVPVLAFFVAYQFAGFRTAILVIMVVMVAQTLLTWLMRRQVNRMFLASTALVVVLGAISLALKNELVFKWKPTILNWVFAVAFLVTAYVGEKTLIQRLLQSVAKVDLSLADQDWRTLNFMWVLYFIMAGAANIFVAYRYSEAVWVNFKLFGLFGLTFLFLLLQAWWLTRRTEPVAKAPPEND